ncbi:MAG: ABC transporter ATP-binding protein [Planctomycetota bacterium]|jgi:molybdopterin-binding protein
MKRSPLTSAWRGIVSGLIMMWARGMSEFGAVVIVAYHPITTPVLIFERFGEYGLSYARPVAVIFITICLAVFVILRLLAAERYEGEYFVLLGPSGVGKTVLLETIAGIHMPDSGRIYLDGKDITSERIRKRRLVLVYQDRSLFPHMTVRRNISYGLRSRGVGRAAAGRQVEGLARDVGVNRLLERRPGALSGGEAQRVALARALAGEPRCLLLDEPISSLDVKSRGRLRSLLRTLNRQGHTMLHVTHDYEEALSLASTIAVMDNGRIIQTGSPMEVLRHPTSEFVANFTGVRNFFMGRLERGTGKDTMADFVTSGPVFRVLTDDDDGPGHLMLRSEDVTVSIARPDTSARNTFEGVVLDVAPARLGIEIIVDIGVEISAVVSAESTERLGLACGQRVWVSFKASAARFLGQ